MRVWNKIKWIAGLLLIFILVLATNLIDRDNFKRLEKAIEAIYEEVLYAKDKTMDLSHLIYEKELAYALNDSVYHKVKSEAANQRISTLLEDCSTVMNSERQKNVFGELQKNCDHLFEQESQLDYKSRSGNVEIIAQLETIKSNILDLTELHLQEGSKQKHRSKSAMDSTNLYTRMEIWVLVILASIILFLIIYTPKDHVE